MSIVCRPISSIEVERPVANRTPTGSLFTFRMIPLISGVLAERGIDASSLLAEVGLPAEALRGEITAPLARIQKFVELAAKRLDSPLFGMELAERVPSGAFGIAEFLVRSAATLQDGLDVLCELAPLVNPIGDFRYVATADGGELHYAVLAQRDTLGCHLNEYTVAFIVKQIGIVLGEPTPRLRAWFSHARPQHAESVAERLDTNVTFQAPDCGFALARSILDRKPRTSDAALFGFLLAQARTQLTHLGTHDVVSQVVRVIDMRLPHGDVAAAAIASAMATTIRSLQRHLADAGTSFREVLAHVRNRRRAELARGGMSETEIAHHLGFADARSMRRSLDDSRPIV
jgi:AraC-like DNA-binding protein